jgi:hypothetical protein
MRRLMYGSPLRVGRVGALVVVLAAPSAVSRRSRTWMMTPTQIVVII